jgi:MFS family permease
MGRFADHSNKVVIVALAVLMGAVSTLGLVFIPQILGEPFNLLSIAILFAVSSATATMAFTVMSAVFGTAYQGRAGEGFGLYEAAIGFAQFSAPIIGGLLWENIAPVAPFLLVGLSGFVLIPIYVFGMMKYEAIAEKALESEAGSQDI